MRPADRGVAISRFRALHDVVHHIAKGPRAVFPSQDASNQWLESFLKMSQYDPVSSPYEARSLYVVPNLLAPAKLRPIVRTAVWNRSADRELCEHMVPEGPDVDVAYFEIHEENLSLLDATIKELDSGLCTMDFAVTGLDLAKLHPVEARDEDDEAAIPEGRNPRNRWLARTTSFSIELRWIEGSIPHVDGAWLRVWDALGMFCQPENEIKVASERYRIAPDQYARLVLSTQS